MGLVVVVLGSPEGEPKLVSRAFMPLHSLLLDGSYPDSAACPTLCRPHAAAARSQHQRGLPIREGSHSPGSSSYLTQHTFQRIIGSQTSPVLTRKQVVVQ